MRKTASGFVTVRAVSGTHVVFLAFNMKKADANGLMGFAIQRTDLTEDETVWLRGNKTFASIRPPTGIEDASSHEHPFQGVPVGGLRGEARPTLPLPRHPHVRHPRRADGEAGHHHHDRHGAPARRSPTTSTSTAAPLRRRRSRGGFRG